MNESQIRESITYAHEGPLTTFVLIARACDLAARGIDPSLVAEVLQNTLSEMGRLVAEDEPDRGFNSADGCSYDWWERTQMGL